MKRFLVSGTKHDPASCSSKRTGPRQQRLSQCKKVVKLSASKYVIRESELQALRETLETSSASEELLHALRTLDSLMLHRTDLTKSQVGKSVKQLRKHSSAEVSSLASRLTTKWREIVLAECGS